MAFIGERELRVIRRLIPAGGVILDYGCGTGRTTFDHLRRGCRVTAYALSVEMVARAEVKARRAGYTAEFITQPDQLSGQRWPVMTCISVLDYYPDRCQC
jgi:2-polyprenyl-3-methyl-5-hydroxy-6-metoxy-1,4-benzoquinol methylase